VTVTRPLPKTKLRPDGAALRVLDFSFLDLWSEPDHSDHRQTDHSFSASPMTSRSWSAARMSRVSEANP
jgi:hypothetical protein